MSSAPIKFTVTLGLMFGLVQGCGSQKEAVYFTKINAGLQNVLRIEPVAARDFQNALGSLPDFEWKTTASLPFGRDEKILTLQLYYQDVPVEGAHAKTVEKNGNFNWVSGSSPALFNSTEVRVISSFEASEDEALKAARNYLSEDGIQPLGSVSRLYFSTPDKELRAAYRFEFELSHGEPITVVVDAENNEVVEMRSHRIHVNGKAKLYSENKVASLEEGLKVQVLPDLLDEGSFLSHSLFKIYSCEGEETAKCTQQARSIDGDFTSIPFASPLYDELVAYHAISRSLRWYRNFEPNSDFELSESSPLKVFVRTEISDQLGNRTRDNAAYTAKTSVRDARIEVGSGFDPAKPEKKSFLNQLGKDADVFIHEFGHHIVYRSLKYGGEQGGQTGDMHEGISDYFTYAITGNNKLAESVTFSGKPLRQGNKTIRFQNIPKSAQVHDRGELWSSAMWDTRLAMGFDQNGSARFDKIVWDAVLLMKADAQYYDALHAFTRATDKYAIEQKENSIEMKEKMFQAFASRGYIASPLGNGILPRSLTTVEPALDETPEQPVAVTSKEKGFCGVIASPHTKNSFQMWLLTLPLLLSFLSRKKRA